MRTFDPNSKQRPYEQVAAAIRDAITAGEFKPGARLPSRVELAAHFDVAPMTASNAIRKLEEAGIVVGRVGSGVFVRTDAPAGVDLEAEVADLRERVARLERHLNLTNEEGT